MEAVGASRSLMALVVVKLAEYSLKSGFPSKSVMPLPSRMRYSVLSFRNPWGKGKGYCACQITMSRPFSSVNCMVPGTENPV